MMHRIFYRIAGLLFTGALAYAASTPVSPPQPASGPGGSAYPYAGVLTYGPFTNAVSPEISDQYYIYQPAQPTPAAAPAVLFLHGYGADSPQSYLLWIEHMVKQGFTVVWVLYDAGAADTFVTNEVSDWKAALNRIATTEGMTPVATGSAGEKLTGVVGHSAGAYTAFQTAIVSGSPSNGIPRFQALFAVEPGQGQIPTYDFSTMNSNTLVTMVVGDQDTSKRHCTASQIWAQMVNVPQKDRNFLEVISDSHGTPAQIGNHYFSLTDTSRDTVPPPVSVDDRDYNVTWKLSVATLDCAFYKQYCTYAASGGSSPQVNMGAWSDGARVTPLSFVANPPAAFAPDCAASSNSPADSEPVF